LQNSMSRYKIKKQSMASKRTSCLIEAGGGGIPESR